MVFYLILGERQPIGQIDYNVPVCGFVEFSADDKVSHSSIFTKNWGRLPEGEVTYKLSV